MRYRRRRQLALAVTALTLASGCDADRRASESQTAPGGRDGGVVLARVMTRNVYAGAPLEQLFEPGLEASEVPAAAAALWADVESTDFSERAVALAGEVARERPHLIGLQEVAVYLTQTPGDAAFGGTTPAADTTLDFRRLLLSALAARGLEYALVSASQNFVGELPILDPVSPNSTTDIRLIDFDAILARSDVEVANPQHGQFEGFLKVSIGGTPLSVHRGWASIDARIAGSTVRFLTTHLEPGDIEPQIQVAQGRELLAAIARLDRDHGALPTILVGDLNSAADGSETPTYGTMISAGFSDVWDAGDDGNTCCQASHLRNERSLLDRRYDFILVRGDLGRPTLSSRSRRFSTTVGAEPRDRTPSGLWPSDHAGVVATILLPQPAPAPR